MKQCNKCLETKPLEEFFRDKATSDGLYTSCKSCKKVATYRWRAANRESYNSGMRKYQRKHRRRQHYKYKYGLTPEAYQALLDSQNGACAICLKTSNGKLPLCVDHCHTTGTVRGILCHGCNRAIAILDKPDLLNIALSYLKRKAA
jgi:hypothetical protein